MFVDCVVFVCMERWLFRLGWSERYRHSSAADRCKRMAVETAVRRARRIRPALQPNRRPDGLNYCGTAAGGTEKVRRLEYNGRCTAAASKMVRRLCQVRKHLLRFVCEVGAECRQSMTQKRRDGVTIRTECNSPLNTNLRLNIRILWIKIWKMANKRSIHKSYNLCKPILQLPTECITWVISIERYTINVF